MASTDRIYDYRDCSQWSYDLAQAQPNVIGPLPNGWSIVDSTFVKESEFGAVIFKNDITKEMVVAFRGTEKTYRDWATNFALARPGYKPEEFLIAERYMEKALANAPEGYMIRTTGHSQGAGLAHYMGIKHDVPSVGFNTSPGNIYLNEIYKTLPKGGSASHIDFRASETGTRGTPMFDSDVVSGLESPMSHPVGGVVTSLSPGAGVYSQVYMDPITGVQSVYLPTGCTDPGMCHSLTNFGDAQLDRVRATLGQDLLPNEVIIGGEDQFKACFETRDVSVLEALKNEVVNETEKAYDAASAAASAAAKAVVDSASEGLAAAEKMASDAWDATKDTVGDAWDATKDAASDAWDATKDTANEAWDATKDAANDAWDATKDTASDVYQWGKDKAGGAMDWAKDEWNSAWGDDAAADGASMMTLPPVDVTASPLGTLSSGAGAGTSETITALDDQAEQLADEADGHADRAETAARRARSAARRAAAAAARMRAMLSRRRY